MVLIFFNLFNSCNLCWFFKWRIIEKLVYISNAFGYICLMRVKKIILILFLAMSLSVFAGSIDTIDSLEAQLSHLDGVEQINTLLALSESYRNVAFNDCLQYGLKAAKLANQHGAFNLEAKVYKSIGISCYFNGELDMANDYYRKGLSGFVVTNDSQEQANCLNNIGLVFEEISNFDSADFYLEQSFLIEKKIGNKAGMGISLLQLGNVAYYGHELQKAADNYYQAMLLFREESDSVHLGLSYNSLGIIYREWNLFDKSLGYYNQAVPIFEHLGDDRSLSQVLTNLAEVYNVELKDYKKAQQLYEQSLSLKHKMNDKIGIALLNNNLGTLYANMEDTEKAFRYFQISKQLYEEFDGETGLVMVLYNMGAMYLVVHDYETAITYLLESLRMAEEYEYVEFIGLNQESIMHCYAATGNYDQYQRYYKLSSLGKDTLIDKLYQLQSKQTEIKYQSEESIKEAKALQLSNRLKESEIKKYKLILAGVSALFILLLMVYVLLIKQKKNPC